MITAVFNTKIAVEPVVRTLNSRQRPGEIIKLMILSCPEDLKDKSTKWIKVKVWDERLQKKILDEGDLRRRIQVTGYMTWSKYNDKTTGEEVEYPEIECLSIRFSDSRRDEFKGHPANYVKVAKATNTAPFVEDDDDWCPF